MIKNNTLWASSQGSRFLVMDTYQDEQGNQWVHYRQFDCDEPREFTCFEESFLDRFKQVPYEDQYKH